MSIARGCRADRVRDERPLETFDNRQNAEVHRRGIWSEKQIDTIRIDKPLVGLGGLVPLRLIVIDDELYLFASLAGDFQTTTRVHLFAPQGISLRLHGRRRGERSGLPDRITDANDVALAARGRNKCRRYRQSRNKLSAIHHGAPSSAAATHNLYTKRQRSLRSREQMVKFAIGVFHQEVMSSRVCLRVSCLHDGALQASAAALLRLRIQPPAAVSTATGDGDPRSLDRC